VRQIPSLAIAAAIALSAMHGDALAQAATTTGAPSASPATVADTVLSDLEKKVIDEYYRAKAGVLGTSRTAQPAAAPAADPHSDKGKAKSKGPPKTPPGQAKKEGLPPGLAKRDGLPPGLAKRDKLPPGLQHDPLPADLAAKLPPERPGTERTLVGADVVLIDKATNVVLDILRNVALRAP